MPVGKTNERKYKIIFPVKKERPSVENVMGDNHTISHQEKIKARWTVPLCSLRPDLCYSRLGVILTKNHPLGYNEICSLKYFSVSFGYHA
jgi:hypothetical protein